MPPYLRDSKSDDGLESYDCDAYLDENEEEEVEEEEEEYVDPELLAELEEFKRLGLPTGFTATTKQSTNSRTRKSGGRRNRRTYDQTDDTQMEEAQGTATF